MERLASLPSKARPRALAEEELSFADYSARFAALPPDLQNRVAERWGAAERDALYRPRAPRLRALCRARLALRPYRRSRPAGCNANRTRRIRRCRGAAAAARADRPDAGMAGK